MKVLQQANHPAKYCTLINVHAPTNKKMEEIKEEFYNLLDQNINQTARSDIKIIHGDFNAKLVQKTYTNPLLSMEVYIMKPTTE